MESVEARLNRLGEISKEVDGRIDSQLSRKSELDSMKVSQEGLSAHVKDLQKLVTSLKADKSLPQMEERTVSMASRLESFDEKLQAFELMEQAFQDREKRAEELGDYLAGLQSTVGQNNERVSVLNEELDRLNDGRREWLQEVHRVGEEQKSVQAQSKATNEQLAELRALTAELEQKRADLQASEQRIAKHEERLAKIEGMMQGLDGKIAEVGQKQQSVDKVKQQVENLFEATEQTRNDAMNVLEARQDVLETGKRLEFLLRDRCSTPNTRGSRSGAEPSTRPRPRWITSRT